MDLGWNQNLKYSWQEKNETEKADSDADPAGEGVHVQAGGEGVQVHAAIICEVILLICNFFHLRCPSKYSWLQPRGVTAACMAGPNTKPMVCKQGSSLGQARVEQKVGRVHLE